MKNNLPDDIVESTAENPNDLKSEESYPEEDFKEHTAEILRQRIISDGENWINRLKSHLKLSDENFEFTADNVRREIRKYSWKLDADENMKQDVINKINDADDRLDYPWIYQAAALLLTDFKKWSPYSSFPWKENLGVWIKALLGKRHFENFIEEKKNCIKELTTVSSWWEKRALQDMLASCEMDYIFHNVLWANNIRYFGDREGSNGQDWERNPTNLILSEKFANELKWLMSNMMVHYSSKIN